MNDSKKWERVNEVLAGTLYKKYPDQWQRVIGQDMCDIDGSFLGFVMTYKNLAELIPLDWTVYDFGCAYAPQAYYFRKHHRYVGIDSGVRERFAFENTSHHSVPISEFLSRHATGKKEFAICNFVPSHEVDLVKEKFKDLFIYYPQN